MLKFDYEKVNGAHIRGVYGTEPRILNDASFSCELVSIQTDNETIVISVNIDTDELVMELDSDDLKFEHNPYDCDFREKLVDIDPVLKLKGKSLGWTWSLTNQQGYSDGLLFGFGDEFSQPLNPAIALVGQASEIAIHTISPLRPPSAVLGGLKSQKTNC